MDRIGTRKSVMDLLVANAIVPRSLHRVPVSGDTVTENDEDLSAETLSA